MVKDKKKKIKKFTRSMYFWLILSYLLPVVGGFIVYFIYREKNYEFADFCLISGILNPLLIGFLEGVLLTYYFPQRLFLSYLLYFFSGIIICYMLIFKLYKNNPYKWFFLIYWFSLLGLVFSYCNEKNKILKEKLVWFTVLFFMVSSVLNIGTTCFSEIYLSSKQNDSFHIVIDKPSNITVAINSFLVINETATLSPYEYYYVCLNLTDYYPYFEYSINSVNSKPFDIYLTPQSNLRCFENPRPSCIFSYYNESSETNISSYHNAVNLEHYKFNNEICFIIANPSEAETNIIYVKLINYNYPPNNLTFKIPSMMVLKMY